MTDMETNALPLSAGGSTVFIDDGTREYKIQNRFGQALATVHFRPADFSLLDRCIALKDDFQRIAEPLKSIQLNSDGTAAFDEDWEKIKRAETELIGKIGEIFDTDEITAIFARRNAFSIVGGEFFSYLVVQALLALVRNAVAEESELAKQRMAPYLEDLGETADETAALETGQPRLTVVESGHAGAASESA